MDTLCKLVQALVKAATAFGDVYFITNGRVQVPLALEAWSSTLLIIGGAAPPQPK